MQIIEKVGENHTSSEYASLTDSITTPDTESEMEPEQTPQPLTCPLLSDLK